MSERQFVNGLKIRVQPTMYGDILKCGINVSDFCDNNLMNERGWINFDIKKGKSGKWYAEINNYGKNDNNNQENFNEEEIPF